MSFSYIKALRVQNATSYSGQRYLFDPVLEYLALHLTCRRYSVSDFLYQTSEHVAGSELIVRKNL